LDTGISTTRDDGRRLEQFFAADAVFWKDVYARADVFSAVIQRRHALALHWIDRLSLPPGPVLEVGCGAGVLAVALAERGMSVWALDPVAPMIALTGRRAAEAGLQHRVTLCLGDAQALEFEDASFQLVTALAVLPWLPSPSTAADEIARVLRPGGWAIVSTHNWGSFADFLDPLRNPLVAPIKRAVKRVLPRAGDPAQFGRRVDRPGDFDRMLRRAGLRKVASLTCGFGPFTLFRRPVLSERVGLAIERRLEALAEHKVVGIRSGGWNYLVLVQKSGLTTGGA
jgi:ubiquinone/menaquinone biosynthesis C-methylase UbiE